MRDGHLRRRRSGARGGPGSAARAGGRADGKAARARARKDTKLSDKQKEKRAAPGTGGDTEAGAADGAEEEQAGAAGRVSRAGLAVTRAVYSCSRDCYT